MHVDVAYRLNRSVTIRQKQVEWAAWSKYQLSHLEVSGSITGHDNLQKPLAKVCKFSCAHLRQIFRGVSKSRATQRVRVQSSAA